MKPRRRGPLRVRSTAKVRHIHCICEGRLASVTTPTREISQPPNRNTVLAGFVAGISWTLVAALVLVIGLEVMGEVWGWQGVVGLTLLILVLCLVVRDARKRLDLARREP
jgi:hypothetical protein